MSSEIKDIRSRIVTSDDVELYVIEAGDRGNPAILFLHGFPDDHSVWINQFEALSEKFHVICFDTRGVGNSSWSGKKNAYRIETVLADINAVIEATRGLGGKVHLVGHDWGSVLGWSFVFSEEYAQKIESWTSISGPPLGIVWHKARDDFQSGSPKRISAAISQVAHSWYIYSMFIPGFWERCLMPISNFWLYRLVYSNVVKKGSRLWEGSKDAINDRIRHSIGLYRDNIFQPPELPKANSCSVPTQLIIANKDKFIRPAIFDTLDRYVNNLTRKTVNAGHWVQISNADYITGEIQRFVSGHKERG